MKLDVLKNVRSYIMVASLIAIGIVFSILTNGIFFSPRNVSLLARQATIDGVLAIGMMFVMVAGHIDLSVGSVLGFAGNVAAVLMVWHHWGTIPAILVTILVGMAAGAWNGYWVAYRKVPAFIITLGGLLAFKGAKLGLGQSMSIAPMNPDFAALGQSYLPAEVGWVIAGLGVLGVALSVIQRRRSAVRYHADKAPLAIDILKASTIGLLIVVAVLYVNRYQGIPVPVLIMLVLAVIFTLLANKTIFGRNVYAIGGNLEAASLSGIRTRFTTLVVFVVSCGLASIAGMILTARLDAATPAAGDTMELDAIAACVIGGTSMSGGVGRIPAVLVGALVMASLDNGMSLINLQNYWQFIVKGLVLTLAVWVDTSSRRSSK